VTLVSVILPVRNEAENFERSLRAILSQDYPMDKMEVIVADGLSEDGTQHIVNRFQKDYPNLKMVDNPGRIVSTGLNTALQSAKGEIIIRVDGHCEIAPDYVSCCVAYLQDEEVDVVGGSMDTEGQSYIASVIALAMSSPFGVGNSPFRTVKGKTMLVDSVPFPAYRREMIEKAGYFDEELVRNQDDEYNYRLRKQGSKILLAKDVKSKYYSRSSFHSLWRQYFQYGYWKVRVLQKHPGQMRLRQFVPLMFVLCLFVSAVLAMTTEWGVISFGMIIGCYGIANLLASFWTARKELSKIFLLPLAFAILHLSYGLGFLWGLAKFVHRWGDKAGMVPSASN